MSRLACEARVAMGFTDVAFTVMAHAVLAYIDIAFMVIGYVVMACVVVAASLFIERFASRYRSIVVTNMPSLVCHNQYAITSMP